MPRVELYRFRFRDPLTGKWLRARYVATKADIAASHAEFEIVGPPEIRQGKSGMFSPWKVVPHDELMRITEPPPEVQPHLAQPPAIDAIECFLAATFLRRYVTYCARRRRFAQMQGAERLHAELAAAHRQVQLPPGRVGLASIS